MSSDQVIGYVIIQGDPSDADGGWDGADVIVDSNGRLFKTYMEALVYGKVSCPEPWRVLSVRRSTKPQRG